LSLFYINPAVFCIDPLWAPCRGRRRADGGRLVGAPLASRGLLGCSLPRATAMAAV
jgi:hypothetical protein